MVKDRTVSEVMAMTVTMAVTMALCTQSVKTTAVQASLSQIWSRSCGLKRA